MTNALIGAQDVVIEIGIEIESVKNKFAKIKNNIQKEMNGIRKKLSIATNMPASDIKNFFGITKTNLLKNLRSQLSDARLRLQDVGIAERGALLPMKSHLVEAKKGVQELTKSMRIAPFQGWALSIMFFGMAIQRTLDGIWKQSSKTFNDVMHSVDGTVTGFDLLNGSLTYLKFTTGQALEPIAQMLVPIIDGVSNWVSQNQDTVTGIFEVGSVVARVFSAGGVVILGIAGVTAALKKVGESGKELKNMGWKGIGSAITKGIGSIEIGLGIADIASAIADADKGVKDIVQGVLKIAGGALIYSGNPYAIAIGVILTLLSTDTIWNKINDFFQKLGQKIVDWASVIGNVFGAIFSKDLVGQAYAINDLLKLMGKEGVDLSGAQSKVNMSVAPLPMSFAGSQSPMSVDNSTNTYYINVEGANDDQMTELMSVVDRNK